MSYTDKQHLLSASLGQIDLKLRRVEDSDRIWRTTRGREDNGAIHTVNNVFSDMISFTGVIRFDEILHFWRI